MLKGNTHNLTYHSIMYGVRGEGLVYLIYLYFYIVLLMFDLPRPLLTLDLYRYNNIQRYGNTFVKRRPSKQHHASDLILCVNFLT